MNVTSIFYVVGTTVQGSTTWALLSSDYCTAERSQRSYVVHEAAEICETELQKVFPRFLWAPKGGLMPHIRGSSEWVSFLKQTWLYWLGCIFRKATDAHVIRV